MKPEDLCAECGFDKGAHHYQSARCPISLASAGFRDTRFSSRLNHEQPAEVSHTSGPLRTHMGPGEKLSILGPSGFAVARVNDMPVASAQDVCDARLLAAAYTSYDRHFGPDAVAAAEEDLLGAALDALADVLTNYAECAKDKGSASIEKWAHVKRARAVLSRVRKEGR